MNRSKKRLSRAVIPEEYMPIKKTRHHDYIAALPDEILIYIFSFISHKDLYGGVRSVCKRWYNLSSTATLWKKITAHDKVPLNILCSWLENSPLLKELELIDRDRKEVNIIAKKLCKFCKGLESLKVENSFDYDNMELLEGKTLCRLLESCKYLTNLYFSGVKILSSKFFQMLANRKPMGMARKCSYFGPVSQKQMKALVESIVANENCDAATLFASGNKKIRIQEVSSNGEEIANIDTIWNDIINNLDMNDENI